MKAVENNKKFGSKRKSDTNNNNNDEPKTKYGKTSIVRSAAEFFGNATLLPTTIAYDSSILPDAIFLTNSSGQLITTPVNSIPTSNSSNHHILQEKTNISILDHHSLNDETSNLYLKNKREATSEEEGTKNAAATPSSTNKNKKNNIKKKPSALPATCTTSTQLLHLLPHSQPPNNHNKKKTKADDFTTEATLSTLNTKTHKNNKQTSSKKKKKTSTTLQQNIIKGLPSLSDFTTIATLPSIQEALKLTKPPTNGITLRFAASPPPPHPPLSVTTDLVPQTSTLFKYEHEEPQSPEPLLPSTVTISPPLTPNLSTTQLLASPAPALTTSFVFTNGIAQKDTLVETSSQTFSGATFSNFPLIASGLTAGNLAGFAAQTNFTTFSLQAPLLAPGLTIPLYNSLVTVSTKEGILPTLNKDILSATKLSAAPKATKASKKKTTSIVSSGQNGNDMTASRGRKRTAQSRLPAKLKEPAAVARRNARERRRVKMVNDGFLRLRRHVPTDPKNKKLSKVKTLRLAIEYIDHLQQLLQSDSTTKQTQQSIMTSFTAQISDGDYDDLDVDGDDMETENWLQSNSLNRVDQELDEDIFTAVDPARLRTTYTEFVTR